MPAPQYGDLLSAALFGWLMTLLVIGSGVVWLTVDTIRLRRALRDDTSRPSVRDRVFGSIIGLLIGTIGLGGALLHLLG